MGRLVVLASVLVLAGGVASAQPTYDMTDTLPGTFIDISGTGTDLQLGDDGTALIQTTVGNDLIPAGDVYVWSNGNLGLTDDYVSYNNRELPTSYFYGGGGGLAPFWDDMNPSNHGAVYWEEQGDTLIVQWNEVPHYGHYTDYFTYQVQIFGSGSTLAQFLYPDVEVGSPSYDWGASATVGWQISDTDGQSWSHNNPVISNDTVLSIIPEPTSLLLLGLGVLALRRR